MGNSHGRNRILTSLVAALMLASAGLFLVGQMSEPALSDIGPMPDLTLTHLDIQFSNNHPVDGDVVEICATIHNIGNATALEAQVDFFDHFNGTLTNIARTSIPEIPAGHNATTCVQWTAHPAGVHGILVKADPENWIPELNEDNNAADKSIEVLPKTDLLPDLTVGDISFSNEHPKEGQFINICVTVKNIGDAAAEDVPVLFIDIYNGSHSNIGTKIISRLGPGESAQVCVEWQAAPVGMHIIWVKVDPENRITEKNEDNNGTDRRITVDPLEQHDIFLTLVLFDNDGNGKWDDVVILVSDGEHRAVVGAEVFIDGHFLAKTPDTGTLFAYNFSQGWHVVKIHFGGEEIQEEFFSQG